MSINIINDLKEYNKFLCENPKVVVDFFAVWCPPCRRAAPIYDEFSESFPDIKFVKIDVDKSKEILKEIQIDCIPTFIFYENKKIKNRMEGADPDGLKENLEKMGTYKPPQEPENLINVEYLEEYEKITKEKKIVVVVFFVEWCPTCQSIIPFYKKLAQAYSSIVFIKVDVDKAKDISKKEEINSMPTFVFYYNSKKNNRLEGASPDLLENTVKEYLNNSEVETFKSNQHEHTLKKIKRNNCTCSVCEEGIDKKDDVYFCLDCQFNLCQDCKDIEKGKKEKKEYLLEPIKDSQQYEEVIKTFKKVALYYFKNPCSVSYPCFRKTIQSLKDEYPEIKFYKIKYCEKTKDITKDLTEDVFTFYQNGKFSHKSKGEDFYFFNAGLIKLSNRETCETFTSEKHEHPLIKVKHLGFSCDICRYVPDGFEGLETIFRCNKCDFDYCLKCKEKEEKRKK